MLLGRCTSIKGYTKPTKGISSRKSKIGTPRRHYAFGAGVPLTEPLSNAPIGREISEIPATEYKYTELPNGTRFFTVNNHQPLSYIGTFIRSGSRNEDHHTTGASFVLKHMGFQSNVIQPYAVRLVRTLELADTNYTVSSGREHVSYVAEFPSEHAEYVTPILADVLFPRTLDHELEENHENIEANALDEQRDPQTFLFELLHQAAYKNSGLGRSIYPREDNFHHLNRVTLQKFRHAFHTPERISVVAVGGLDHEALTNLYQKELEYINRKLAAQVEVEQEIQRLQAEKKLTDKFDYLSHPYYVAEAGANLERARGKQFQGTTANVSQKPYQDTPSKYHGGEISVPTGDATHFAVGFEGVSATDNDYFPAVALQYLLGRGKLHSRSAGYGASSRLQRAVDDGNKVGSTPTVKELFAFNFHYTDSGLFGVFGAADPTSKAASPTKVMLDETTKQLKNVRREIGEQELTRAKNRYKAEFLSNCQTRQGLLQFYGAQTINGKRGSTLQQPEDFIAALDKVSVQDVKRVADRILKSNPTIVAVGNTSNLLSSNEIKQAI